MVVCPACEGHGPLIPVFVKAVEGKKPDLEALANADLFRCRLCGGTNQVTPEVAERYARGRVLANKRKQACYGPREYADFLSILPSDLLDMEQGRKEPIEFEEPPVRTVTLSCREITDLMKDRDRAEIQRDWLRLIFRAEASGIIYENDEHTGKVMEGNVPIVVDEDAVPVYNAKIEHAILAILQHEGKKWPTASSPKSSRPDS